DALALLAASDLRETRWLRHGGEQLVVLAETDVLELRPGGERDALEFDREPALGSRGDVRRIDGEPVRHVEQGGSIPGELLPLLQPKGGPAERRWPDRGARSAERPCDYDRVAGTRARAARHALRASYRRDAEQELLGAGRVAADHRHAGLGDTRIKLE